MEKYLQLFEFIGKLIDVQIKKYKALATLGVGPDAGINATLVMKQVVELIDFANVLLTQLTKSEPDDEIFFNIFNQVHFYVEQEHLRSYAGWLIDENNIHNTVYDRIKEYQADLKQIRVENKIEDKNNILPVTETQKQCEHDSHAIAFKITDIAMKLRENPDMDLDEIKIPNHAQKILRKHASPNGRYHYEKHSSEIIKIYNQTKKYLDQSQLTITTDRLASDEAKNTENEHRNTYNGLLDQFKKIKPDSILFSPDFTGYSIAKSISSNNNPSASTPVQPATKNSSSGNYGKFTLFAISASTCIMASLVYYLVNYPSEKMSTMNNTM